MMRIWILTMLGVLAWAFLSRACFVYKFCPDCYASTGAISAPTDTLAELPNSPVSTLPESPLAVSTDKMVEKGETFYFDRMTFTDTTDASSGQPGNFHLTPEFVAYTDSLIKYCTQFPNTKVILTGYSDITDTAAADNFEEFHWIDSVKGYLSEQGLDGNKITVAPKLIKERRSPTPDGTGKGRKRRLQISIEHGG